MEIVTLSPSGTKKVLKNVFELYKQDIEDSLRGITPGQWCLFSLNKRNQKFIGYINPHVEDNRPCAYIIEAKDKDIEPWAFIQEKLEKAIEKREEVYGYGGDARLVYGQGDKLPGLIVDSYQNCLYIQINTAGLDSYREQLRDMFSKKFPSKEILFLDNEKYRKGEILPTFENNNNDPAEIEIKENELLFKVNKENKQKIGYYYDHRVNRSKAASSVSYLKGENLRGLDLFCYIGSWGLNLLKAGVSHVDFVDQGRFDQEIVGNLELNGFKGQGEYFRKNVFDYLKENKENKYDIICSDPPAFCKSKKEKRRAIDGYIKLHRLCLGMLKRNSIFLACSCTHYVDHMEFQQTVIQAAKQCNKNIQLIDVGMQGLDHPLESTEDKESYLKYYAYYVE